MDNTPKQRHDYRTRTSDAESHRQRQSLYETTETKIVRSSADFDLHPDSVAYEPIAEAMLGVTSFPFPNDDDDDDDAKNRGTSSVTSLSAG